MNSKNIALIGAGISGMASAYMLMQKGFRVTIYAAEFSPNITSNKAAAFWFPYHIRNDNRGIDWCISSYKFYGQLAQQPETGISMKQLHKVVQAGNEEAQPAWINFIPAGAIKILPVEKLKPGFAKIYDVTVPLIETQIFLPWLQSMLQKNGVIFIKKTINSFDEVKDKYDYVVNCSGLGARELSGDNEMIPVRGQVALLSPLQNLPIYLDNETPLYIVPRKDAIIVGGTFEEHIESETTEATTIQRILKNACQAMPELEKQELIGSWAGLRPYRKEVRVEKDKDLQIIHNYGHGGSGFTLAFGCAKTVAEMID